MMYQLDCFISRPEAMQVVALRPSCSTNTDSRGHTDARYQIMRYLDWYNHRRRHSALQMQSPVNYEQELPSRGSSRVTQPCQRERVSSSLRFPPECLGCTRDIYAGPKDVTGHLVGVGHVSR